MIDPIAQNTLNLMKLVEQPMSDIEPFDTFTFAENLASRILTWCITEPRRGPEQRAELATIIESAVDENRQPIETMDEFRYVEQFSKWEHLRHYHPSPWYLDKCNDREVEVKDNRGDTVFYEDFGSIPSEWPSSRSEPIVTGSMALAHWLVAYSQNPRGL